MAEHARRSTDQLENRLEFETLIAEMSSRFINLPSAEVDAEIELALRRVCELLDIDLAVLWQWSTTDADLITPTHVHYAWEGPRPSEPMRQAMYPWSRREMLAGRMIVVPSLETLPEEAAVDRETCRLFGIKAVLCIPLAVGGKPSVGALGFNCLRSEHDWPAALVKRLQFVGQIFTNALSRKRHEIALRESEERLSLAADAAGVGLWTLDYESRTFWATEKARAIFGYSLGEIITMESFEALVHPEDVELVRSAIERSVGERVPIDVEYRIVPPDGTVRWMASRGTPQFKASGELDRVMGVSIDITERRRAEEAFRVTEARMAAAAELAGLAFYEVNFGEGVVYNDDRFREICGFPSKQEQGLEALQFWMEHLHPDDRQQVLDLRAQLHAGIVDPLIIEYRYLHPIDGEKWIHHIGRVLERDASGKLLVSFGVLRDITESKRSEEALRELSRHLIGAHEEERALLARELHDDVTQRLAVLAIEVGRAELAAAQEPLAEAMRSVREGLVRLSEDVHTLAYQLHPSVLEELGLGEALRTECERLGRRSGLALAVELDPVPSVVAKDAVFCLFRVAQEALNNAIRHSEALSATVTVRQFDGGLLLSVRDDGIGFDPAAEGRRKSLGLASMRERVKLVNGTLDIESAPGRGAAIIAWVPANGGSQ
ncbi:MAG: PAS domain-containing protein [Thermoanaerobaculia bacterium]|jgi:PAS domain S-box-containing protein